MRRTMERLNIKRRHNRGDRCECDGCRGRLTVYTTIVNHDEQRRTQYISCNLCHWKPEDNKLIIPLEFAPPMSRED